MKRYILTKYSVIILTLLLTGFFQLVSAQETQDTTHKHHGMKTEKMSEDSTKMHHNTEMKSAPKDSMHSDQIMYKERNKVKHPIGIEIQGKGMDSGKSSIVRKGEIDLSKIDKNKDGKVFQDHMDWNVISDEAGRCPICGMKLKEVTIEDAKKNLIENEYKVK